VEEGQHWFRGLFPDPYWAIATPLMVMVSMMSLAGGTIGLWMIRANEDSRTGRPAQRRKARTH
jgi:flagellar basal body-associated protein FliL